MAETPTAEEQPKTLTADEKRRATGRWPYPLTAEDRRRGALNATKARSERIAKARQKPLEVIREKLETDTEAWLEPYRMARERGDWRAAEALLDRVYGKPVQRTEHTVAVGQQFVDLDPGALDRLIDELGPEALEAGE